MPDAVQPEITPAAPLAPETPVAPPPAPAPPTVITEENAALADVLEEANAGKQKLATPPPPAEPLADADTEEMLSDQMLMNIADLEKIPVPKVKDVRDLRVLLSFLVGGDKADKYVEKLIGGRSKAEMAQIFADPESVYNYLRRAVLHSLQEQDTPQRRLMLRFLEERNPEQLAEAQADTTFVDKHLHVAKSLNGKVTGKRATLSVIAMLSGIEKVFLLNSGFWVHLRPFTVAELHTFFNTVDTENQELGRHLGGVFYSFVDLNLREKFMEFFASAVQHSNLVGWEDPEVLLKNLSLNDYDICVWAVCKLMYSQGVTVPLVCANPECGYRDEHMLVDLGALRLNFYTAVDRLKLEELLQKKSVTPEELEAYRASNGFVRDLDYPCQNSPGAKMRYTLRVPTVAEYLAGGKSLLAQLSVHLGKNRTMRDKQCVSLLSYNLHRMFFVWVKQYAMVQEDGKVEWWTDEEEAILASLESTVHDKTKLYDDVAKFMSDSRISHLAYHGIKCPTCGAEMGNECAVKDLVPVDIHSLFFVLIWRLLQQLGEQPTAETNSPTSPT